MSLASDAPPIIHSPRPGRAAARGHSWSRAFRGEPEVAPAASAPAPSSPPPGVPSDSSPVELESLNGTGDAIAARGKAPAWNLPSNGSMEAGPVMGAESWPALSESTKASPKSASSNSLKALSDGSVSVPPGPASTSPKPNTSNPNPIPTANYPAPVRQKSMKRGGGGGASSSSGTAAIGGAVVQIPMEMPPAALDKQDGPEPSPKGTPNKGSGNWDNGSRGGRFPLQSHGGGDHPRSYGGNRRGGGGGGRGSQHGGFSNRYDHERGSHNWNPPRNFGGRDTHVPLQQHRGHPRPFLSPPPPAAAAPTQFIGPHAPVRQFMNHMGFPGRQHEIPIFYVPTHPPPETLHGMPFVGHPFPHAMSHTMFVPAPSHQQAKLVNQIDYYFSPENLCKDLYLRKNMDDQGWVPISLIAGFNRVTKLTNNIQDILDAVRFSNIVEVQGEKIRKQSDWMNWTLPPSLSQHGATSNQSSPTAADYDAMVAHMQSIGLEEGNTNNRTRGSSLY